MQAERGGRVTLVARVLTLPIARRQSARGGAYDLGIL
jgi:hypothetical protein